MAGFLDSFRKKITASVWKDKKNIPQAKDIDDKIALGVLLWIVAEADEKFLSEEKEKIKEVLISKSKISEEDLPVVLASIKQAAVDRIDLHKFTHEVSDDLSYKMKLSIIDELFRVGCADHELDNDELETIRKISGLFRIEHKDFIDSKIKIKKESSLDTAGY